MRAVSRLLAAAVFTCALAAAGTAGAQTVRAPLGLGNIGLKIGSVTFTDDAVESGGADNGLYIAIENYGKLTPNFYLGYEIGYTKPDGTRASGVETELLYVPVELNLKYVAETAPNLIMGFGMGISYNYAEEEFVVRSNAKNNEWILGGQFFADAYYTSGNYYLGISGKYQITDEFETTSASGASVDFNNWRVSGVAGFMF